jgi:hypothetical protein
MWSGWSICGWAALIVGATIAARLAGHGADIEALRASIRLTATTSLALFLPTFAASSLNALRPSRATKWLLRNRRYLGVSFAISQAAHLVVIVALIVVAPDDFERRLSTTTLIGGGIGYLLIAAMTATSFDRSARWLGRARWRALHVTGMYAIWAILLFSYVGRAATPSYAVRVALLVAALGVRVAARARARIRVDPHS